MIAQKIKYFLWGLILAILIFPSYQLLYPTIIEKPLQGNVVYAGEPKFSWDTWHNGIYQNEYNKFVEDHIGLRSYWVRLNNQLNFSLFKKAYAKGVIAGKDGYLFETKYLDGYYGVNFKGKQKIINDAVKIKFIQDNLQIKDVLFVPVIAPGKATFYSDEIPEWYKKTHVKSLSNYDYYIAVFDSLNVKYIDFNALFLDWKDTSKHVLVPKYGIHWSDYGVGLVLDSLLNYFSVNLNNDNLVKITYDSIFKTVIPQHDDNDIEKGMNLLFPLPSDSLSYPKYVFKTLNKYKPTSLVIADSYYWQIYGTGYASMMFSKNDFWFYYYQNNTLDPNANSSIDKSYFDKKLSSYDIIMTIYTERNFHNMGDGFYNEAYCALKYPEEILDKISFIKNDSTQYKVSVQNSKAWNLPLEKVLWLNAFWYVKEKYKNKL